MKQDHALVASLLSVICLWTVAGCSGSASQQVPPITLSPAAAPDGVVGQAYNVVVAANGGTPPFTLAETTNPAVFPGGQGKTGTPCQGLTMNLTTGSVSGIPLNAGTCGPFTIQATDSSNPAQSVSVNLSIRIAAPLAISTTSLQNGTDGVAYSDTVVATGGQAPLSFSISAGALPAGLGLNATSGAITGTPTAGGPFTFTVQAQDALNPKQTATKQYTILILMITTNSLPNGTVGVPYSLPPAQGLAATGGTGNLIWTLAPGSGSLPSGMNLNVAGVVGGTPTVTGTFNITVQVRDSGTPVRTDTQALSLTINNPVPILNTLTPNAAAAGGPGVNLRVDGGGFVGGSVVRWNGSDRTTGFVSATQLTASITAADIATAGSASVTVFNPTPGGGTSNGLTFTVSTGPPNPVPVLSCIVPKWVEEGSPNTVLSLLGSGFTSTSIVQWDGAANPNLTTTLMSPSELDVVVDSSLLAASAVSKTPKIKVVNPAPGGGTSAAITFTIDAPNTLGVLDRASETTGCVGGNLESGVGLRASDISQHGKKVVFSSQATNLGAGHLFVRNLATGSLSDLTNLFGSQGVPDLTTAVSTDVGDLIVHTTAQLTADDTSSNTLDLYLIPCVMSDAPGGACIGPSERISVQSDGSEFPSGVGPAFGVGASGQYVVFGANGRLYVRDTVINTTTDLCPIFFQAGQLCSFVDSASMAISDSGQLVAFLSRAPLDPLDANDNGVDVYVLDRSQPPDKAFTRLSRGTVRDPNISNNFEGPVMSSSGEFVAFISEYSDLVPNDTNHAYDVFLWHAGTQGGTIERVSLGNNDTEISGPNAGAAHVSISGNGRFVAFTATDESFQASPALFPTAQILVRDTCNHSGSSTCTPRTFVVSQRTDAVVDPVTGITTSGHANGFARYPKLSRDGRFIIFTSTSTNFVPSDTNIDDVYYARTGLP
jgi:hypothetical protein